MSQKSLKRKMVSSEEETEVQEETDSIDIKEEPLPKKITRSKSVKNFQQEWFDEFPSWKDWVVRLTNDSQFYCKYCDKTMLCGKKEIRNHEKTIKHIKKKELTEKMIRYGYIVNNAVNVPVLFAPNGSGIVGKSDDSTEATGLTFKQKVRDAEHKITKLFLENNIPFMLSPKIIGLFKELEPLVLKDIKLSSSKMSLVAKQICALETGQEKIIFPKNRKKPLVKVEVKN